MTINGIDGLGSGIQAGAPMGGSEDAVSKNLRRQISEAQKKLKELSANTEMRPEQKAKRRQEIQKEIYELSNQLRQHQMEEKQKERQKQDSFDDMLGCDKNAEKSGTKHQNGGLSAGSMEAMISADTSMKQSKVQGSVATTMEGKSGVLEIEIKLDSARGGDTGRKQAELSDIEIKAENAVDSQLSTLAKANRKMEEAAKEENASGKSQAGEKTEEEKDEKGKTEAGQGKQPDTAKEEETNYTPVDVRL